jgi:hypothetical protein
MLGVELSRRVMREYHDEPAKLPETGLAPGRPSTGRATSMTEAC